MISVLLINKARLYFVLFICITITNSLIADSIQIIHNHPKIIEAGSEFKIDIKVSKQKLTSFAKIEYVLPIGFTAKEGKSLNAKFILDNKKVKLIWDKLPDSSNFELSISLNSTKNLIGKKSINGSFSYIHKEERKLINLKPIEIEITEYKKETIDSIELSQVGYRLQIAASTRKISINELKKSFNIIHEIREEVHNGMYKYTIGYYTNYTEAKNELYKIISINKVPGAFLTAYINDNRTTLKNVFSLTK